MTAWQYVYNGAMFGDGTNIDVVEARGLDQPNAQDSDVPIPGAHGVLPGRDRIGGRTIEFDLELVEDTTVLYDTLHAFAKAVAVRDDELPLTFQLDDTSPVLRSYCRPRRRAAAVKYAQLHGFVPSTLQFFASDPLLYSEEEESAVAVAFTQAQGYSYPYSYPRSYGAAAVGAAIAATNDGTAPTYWRAVIQGPCTGPTIEGPTGMLKWEGSLTASETLVIDAHPARLTALLNGQASQFILISDDSTWFPLYPGENEVRFFTDNSQGSMTFSWRHAYWSAI